MARCIDWCPGGEESLIGIKLIPEIFEKCSEEKRVDAGEMCEVVPSGDGLSSKASSSAPNCVLPNAVLYFPHGGKPSAEATWTCCQQSLDMTSRVWRLGSRD
jgi:hypothetical protein